VTAFADLFPNSSSLVQMSLMPNLSLALTLVFM